MRKCIINSHFTLLLKHTYVTILIAYWSTAVGYNIKIQPQRFQGVLICKKVNKQKVAMLDRTID